MTIVTAGTASYRHWIKRNREKAREYGYRLAVYDLGGLGFGKPFQASPLREKGGFVAKSPWKPRLIQRELANGTAVLWWLDGDTEIMNRLRTFDADVAISTDFNAGVLFFRNSGKVKRLVEEWISEVETGPTESDQEALRRVLAHTPCTVRLLDPSVWNDKQGTVIRHYEGPKARDLAC